MSTMRRRFAVYDTETTGLSHHHDQIIQFAGIAVDEELNLIKGDEININIKLRPDVVPSPQAFAVHGISIQQLMSNGLTEFDAAAVMKAWMMPRGKPTTISGFNTQRFDDEMMRNTFYRTLIDPYEHEWRDGNNRADILRLATLVFALRPEILTWPVNQEGRISLKLGDLAKENGIELVHAHDARYDVEATISLMRLIKEGNPKMWDYFLKLSDKGFVKPMVEKREPLVLIDPFLSREQSHMTMVLPIIYDSSTAQKMLCLDLRQDPTELLSLPASEIKRRVFTPTKDLGEGEAINGIRDVTVNKQPMIADPAVFRRRDDIVQRAGLDLDACYRHLEIINEYLSKDKGFRERLQEAYKSDFAPCEDVYQGIYSLGLIGRDEQTLRAKARHLEPQKENQEQRFPALVNLDPHAFSRQQARDPLRLFELTLRAKWANFGEEVLERNVFTAAELKEWSDHLHRTWYEKPTGKNCINLEGYKAALDEVKAQYALDDRQEQALIELEAYVAANLEMVQQIKTLNESSQEQLLESHADHPVEDHESKRIEADRKNRESRHPETGLEFS